MYVISLLNEAGKRIKTRKKEEKHIIGSHSIRLKQNKNENISANFINGNKRKSIKINGFMHTNRTLVHTFLWQKQWSRKK